MCPVQIVDAAQLAQYCFGQLQAVVDGRGLRQVDQYLFQRWIGYVDVHAADQIRLVFLSRKPAGGGRSSPPFRERKYRRAARMWLDVGIRMDRDEQIGLDLACLDHAIDERDEIVAVADEDAAHVRLIVHKCLEFPGDRQCDVLFMRATAAPGARILAAVACIDRDGDQAGNIGRRNGLLAKRRPRIAGGWRCLFGFLRTFGGRSAGRRRFFLVEQRHHRIGRLLQRINVEHQTVAVVADRFEHEHLWFDLRFQIQYEAHDARFEATDAYAADIRISR